MYRKFTYIIIILFLLVTTIIPLNVLAVVGTILSFTPADGATNISPSANLEILFNDVPTKGASGDITLQQIAGGSATITIPVASSNVTIVGNTAIINPTGDMLSGIKYAVELDTGAFIVGGSDVVGWSGTSTWAFTITSTDLTLSDISLDGSTISGFSSSTTSYTKYYAASVSSVALTATPTDGSTTVTGSGTKTLSLGDNIYNIVVTDSLDPSLYKTYSVNLHKGSTNANLSDLTIDASTVSGFDPSVTTYNKTVPHTTTSVNIGATLSDSNASLSGTGVTTLNYGNNSIEVTVTAEDTTTEKTYTLQIFRESVSTDATLLDLTLDGFTLTGFTSNVFTYTQSVASGTTNVTIGATSSNANAIIIGTGNKSVSPGDNAFDIDVTAQDGVTDEKYTLTVQVPTPTATPVPTATPTPAATSTPTAVPIISTPKPTTMPTTRPTPRPTSTPSPSPSTIPTPETTPILAPVTATAPPLTLLSKSPRTNQEEVAVDKSIKLAFSSNVAAVNNNVDINIVIIDLYNNTVHDSMKATSSRVSIKDENIVLHNVQEFKSGTEYMVTIQRGAFYDVSHYGSWSDKISWTFSTAGTRPPDPIKEEDGIPDPSLSLSLTVIVFDVQGNPIPGIKVELHSDIMKAMTNETGRVTFSGIELGRHNVYLRNWSNEIIKTYAVNIDMDTMSKENDMDNGIYQIHLSPINLDAPLDVQITKDEITNLTEGSPAKFFAQTDSQILEDGLLELTLPTNPVIANVTSSYANVSMKDGKLIIDYDNDLYSAIGQDTIVIEMILDDDTVIRQITEIKQKGFSITRWYKLLLIWQRDLMLVMMLTLVSLITITIMLYTIWHEKKTEITGHSNTKSHKNKEG